MMANNEWAVAESVRQRNLVKASQILLGICAGVVADGQLHDTEIMYLSTWLKEHAEVRQEWPGNMLASKVEAVIADGVITEVERADLVAVLQELTGNFFLDTGVAQQSSPVLPVNDSPELRWQGASYCFTGKFLFGTRDTCHKAVEKLGAVAVDSITKQLDFLVIGALVSPDWVNETYGRKIQKAALYRQESGSPVIISENQWTSALVGNVG
ncbi:BRCT domain-containing protein [Undibacterium sp. FT147W]|uniref:BRCT domain-containing protein n=1 Tax=Undibacterium rivi TaxID=2828729 RepID=A0ABS5H1S5_9BURK|nr:BRCT domain-containing protein [Undibacterium rivi]MBR7792332.1 BRCT domain-containing protein [Undibacterium rivi]